MEDIGVIKVKSWELVDVSWSRTSPTIDYKLYHHCRHRGSSKLGLIALANWDPVTGFWFCNNCKRDAPEKMQFIAKMIGNVDKRKGGIRYFNE